MWKEFKEFAVKGNAIDLAIGVIIGAAFGKIVTSIVEDLLMPPLGRVLGNLNFADYYIPLSDKITPGRCLWMRRRKPAGPSLGLRQFHHRLDQFPHRRLLHFFGGESDQQIEAPQPVGRACSERLPGLRHVNPDQGNALSALHE